MEKILFPGILHTGYGFFTLRIHYIYFWIFSLKTLRDTRENIYVSFEGVIVKTVENHWSTGTKKKWLYSPVGLGCGGCILPMFRTCMQDEGIVVKSRMECDPLLLSSSSSTALMSPGHRTSRAWCTLMHLSLLMQRPTASTVLFKRALRRLVFASEENQNYWGEVVNSSFTK